MTLKTGAFTNEASLILNPTNYTSGGTNLGLIGSDHLIGFNKDVEMLSRVITASQYTDARILGLNLVYEIILLESSTNVMNLMFDGESASNIFEAYSTYLPGQLVGASQTSKLLLRPTAAAGATAAYLYIPRALVIDLGPVQFAAEKKLLQATRLTIAALWDDSRGAAFHYGDNAGLAAI